MKLQLGEQWKQKKIALAEVPILFIHVRGRKYEATNHKQHGPANIALALGCLE